MLLIFWALHLNLLYSFPLLSCDSLFTSHSKMSWRSLTETPAEYEKSSVAVLLSPRLVTRGGLRAAEQSDLFAIVSSQSAAKYLMGTFLLRHCAIHCNRRLRQAVAGKLPMPSGYSLPTMTQQPGAQTATALSASLATSGSQLNLPRQQEGWPAAKTGAI